MRLTHEQWFFMIIIISCLQIRMLINSIFGTDDCFIGACSWSLWSQYIQNHCDDHARVQSADSSESAEHLTMPVMYITNITLEGLKLSWLIMLHKKIDYLLIGPLSTMSSTAIIRVRNITYVMHYFVLQTT